MTAAGDFGALREPDPPIDVGLPAADAARRRRLERLELLDGVRRSRTVPGPAIRPTYETLVTSALTASISILAAKLAAVVVVANIVGAELAVRLWHGFLPYFAFAASTDAFTAVVTFSTVAMVMVAAGLAVPAALGRRVRPRQFVWGRAVGLAIALETLAFEWLRHSLSLPVIQPKWLWLSAFQVLAGTLLIAIALKRPRNVADAVIGRAAEHEPPPGT